MAAALPAGASADGEDVREDLLDIAAGLTAKVTQPRHISSVCCLVAWRVSPAREQKLPERACDESSLHVSPNNGVDTHRNEITTVLRLWRPLQWAATIRDLCRLARELVLPPGGAVACACRLRRVSLLRL